MIFNGSFAQGLGMDQLVQFVRNFVEFDASSYELYYCSVYDLVWILMQSLVRPS